VNYATLSIIIGLFAVVGAHGAEKKPRHLFVTAKGTMKFHCKVETTDIAEVSEMGHTPLKVSVWGGRSPYKWRLPLYRVRNGGNDIAAAQLGIGRTAGAENTFIITVPTYELETAGALNLELTSDEGQAAVCPTPSAPVTARNVTALKPVRSAVR
jgi:hypothetical protein